MILHPAIASLIIASVLIDGMAIYASLFGIQIIRKWDLQSGSELQLSLERKTYLISTILMYMLVFQIASFFLYIFTAESLHELFVGAMCAAGSLQVNSYGYPVFLLKMINVILAGLWLIINYADSRAFDYPLIRKKYWLLLILAPLILMESVLQMSYFLNLKGDIITSCCGSLFSAGRNTLTSEMASLPVRASMAAFYSLMVLTLLSGIVFIRTVKWAYLFSLAGVITFFASCIGLVSFISVYIYELPTHHCPFCMLQKEYHYIGYMFYVSAIAGVISSAGVGVLQRFRCIGSLSAILPQIQRRLAVTSIIAYFLFTALSLYYIFATDFSLRM